MIRRGLTTIVLGILLSLMMGISHAQRTIFSENFDGGTVSYTSSTGWLSNATYFVSQYNSYGTSVPNTTGMVYYLTSPVYDLTGYSSVSLQFKHICKVSPLDTVWIEYKISGQVWTPIPASAYKGSAANYALNGFSAASYPIWQAADSTVSPQSTWWKCEYFDVSFEVSNESSVEFRFAIKKGATAGTQISYGWLLDDIEITAATNSTVPPTVQIVSATPPTDTVYSVGPYPLTVKIKNNSDTTLATPWLFYYINNTKDSIALTQLNDSLWTVVLPQKTAGTKVLYIIVAKDNRGNTTCISNGYTIIRPSSVTLGNSASIDCFTSPVAGATVGGTLTPVNVILRNRGTGTLSMATINWKINTITQFSKTYMNFSPGLSWDFTDTVNLGNFTPRIGEYDTIEVYLSTVNGMADPDPTNDTVRIITFGCNNIITGTLTIGAGGNFADFQAFKTAISSSTCSPISDVTLAFLNGTYTEGIDLTGISNYMNGYTLTLTSQSGNADDVVFEWTTAGTGNCVTINNTNNVIIKALTFDNHTLSSGNAINFTGACNNVLIRDCKILSHTTTTSTSVIPIGSYNMFSAGPSINNVRIIHNTINGGGYGICFYQGMAPPYFTNIVCDSNTITNSGQYAIYGGYAEFTSISHNTILSRGENAGAHKIWRGISLSGGNGHIIGNRIVQRCTTTTKLPIGIYLRGYTPSGRTFTDTAIIANNEIIVCVDSFPTAVANSGGGIRLDGTSSLPNDAKILYNSIFVKGSAKSAGIDLAANDLADIKYNNIYMTNTSSDAYPIWLRSTATPTRDIDYNNMYAPTNVGYVNGVKTTIAAWQGAVASDVNSFKTLPSFVNSNVNLRLSDNLGFTCPARYDVLTDIDGTPRTTTTTVGCYNAPEPTVIDAALTQLTGLRNAAFVNDNDIVKVVVYNNGTVILDTIKVQWKIDNTLQTPVVWTGNLLPYEYDTITLGGITYSTSGNCTISAFVDSLGYKTDANKSNDTVAVTQLVYSNDKDIELVQLLGVSNSVAIGQTDTLKAVVYNNSAFVMDTISIKWKVGGIAQPTVKWTGSLAINAYDTIELGEVTYSTIGNTTIEAIIDSLGSITDDNPVNDTVKITVSVCTGTFDGIYTVGAGGDFATIAAALSELKSSCSTVEGDVTLAFKTGTYNGMSINLTDISNYMNGYTLTLTSQANHADSVLFTVTAMMGTNITLNNSNNIVIKNITMDESAAPFTGRCITFTGACTNVVIRDCKLKGLLQVGGAGAILNMTARGPIYKATNTGVVDSISFINNWFEAGVQGILFYAGTSSAHGTHIVFDSNTVNDQTEFGATFFYADFSSFKHNRFISTNKLSLSSGTVFMFRGWAGCRLIDCSGDIIGNTVRDVCPNPVSGGAYGFDLTNHNSTISDTALIANNESIFILANGIGINLEGNCKAKILHNSIYNGGFAMYGSDVVKGIAIDGAAHNYLQIKYNNIILTKIDTVLPAGPLVSVTYPIYLTDISNVSNWDIDYNNMYGIKEIGYAATNVNSISVWQSLIPSDLHSVSVLPVLTDSNINSLKIENNDSLLCPLSNAINYDIEGTTRLALTQMGAYTATVTDLDMGLVSLTNSGAFVNQAVTVKVLAKNIGIDTISNAQLSWSKNGVIQGTQTWNPNPALGLMASDTVVLGNFVYDGTPTQIVVWIDSVNHQKDSVRSNDTVTINMATLILASFSTPYVDDTITDRQFDVYATIEESSGALNINPNPALYLKITLGGNVTYDTVPMTFSGGKWSAQVPLQYYGSKVVYSLFVTDTLGNSLTISDSTFIEYNPNQNYSTKNLTINQLSGLDFGNSGCVPYQTDLSLSIYNTGNQAFDFSQTPLSIHLQTTQAVAFSKDTILNSGILNTGDTLIVGVVSNFALANSGLYDFSGYISSVYDSIHNDDTLVLDYQLLRIGLPVDETFTNGVMDSLFYITSEVGTSTWQIVTQGADIDSIISPQFGNGMLSFVGSMGTVSRLYTRQLDLSQTSQPNLSFWYYYDTVPSMDYMDVHVIIGGGVIDTVLFSLNKYDPYYCGWRPYSVDLPAWAIHECVVFAFEAMEKSNGTVTQYIDRIRLTAKQDIELSEIILPDLSACDLQNKEWKVVIQNKTLPTLDYSTTPLNIYLEIAQTGQTFTATRSSGILGGFANDTVTLSPNFNFAPGNYTVKAYFDYILDANINNDTLATVVSVNPKLHLEGVKLSTSGNCLASGVKIQQEVILRNVGNMELENFVLTVEIHGNAGLLQTLTDTIYTALLPDSVLNYTFTKDYTVPTEDLFVVQIFGDLLDCAGNYIDTSILSECAELIATPHLSITTLLSPAGTTDTVDNQYNIKVKIENNGNVSAYNVVVFAKIEQGGNSIYNQQLTLDSIEAHSFYDAEFTPAYTIADEGSYTITVHLSNIDTYAADDTLTVIRTAVKKANMVYIFDKNSISLSQNIPNPATNTTKVEYSLPHDGKATFSICTTAGQVVYNQTVNAFIGTNNIIFDLNGFASGIYFYSMEFEGQKLVRKMSVK
ncbi:MAG: T9SS type A sorting domain-containing protein [Bacteroidales bacterium]|jgi:hypothetical protein|nr:T9SS type A sorting domain-containing protein [Bacteroidales bacterium]